MFLCSKVVLPHMVEEKERHDLLTVSSILAHQSTHEHRAYGVHQGWRGAVLRWGSPAKCGVKRQSPSLCPPVLRKDGSCHGLHRGHDTTDFEEPIIWQKLPGHARRSQTGGTITRKILIKAAWKKISANIVITLKNGSPGRRRTRAFFIEERCTVGRERPCNKRERVYYFLTHACGNGGVYHC